ncbi:tRNA methyltransferase [Haematococcus lacustris]|uniref:tRNA methyltransferase n=1 Tax=Haematococcus lacustris TaxID=44745 RepID=A0A699ZDD5_HAELA|nr:tRNA methyltransferase [Haematococcus lacustris]
MAADVTPMWRFSKPVNSEPTRCLYVTGWPAEQFEYLQVLFAAYGPVELVRPSDIASSYCFAMFATAPCAQAALAGLNNMPCEASPSARKLCLRYSNATMQPQQLHPENMLGCLTLTIHAFQQSAPPPATARTSDQLGVPGLQLLHEFVSPGEEIELLNAVAHGPWQHLAKRRVQHFGWEFDYSVRG